MELKGNRRDPNERSDRRRDMLKKDRYDIVGDNLVIAPPPKEKISYFMIYGMQQLLFYVFDKGN